MIGKDKTAKKLKPALKAPPKLCRQDALMLTLFLIFTLFAFRNVLNFRYSWGAHDMVGGLMRSSAVGRAISEGQIFPRWSRELFGGYGYPLLYFYPPLFSMISGFLQLAGSGVIASVKIIAMISLTASGWFIYRIGLRLGSRSAAVLAAAAWMLFPYRMAVYFTRGALAESLALAVLPLPVLGFLDFQNGRERTGAILLAVGTAALITAHNAVWFISFPFITLWGFAILRGRKIRTCFKTCLAMSAGLLAAAPYWLPAFQHRSLINIGRLIDSPRVDYKQHFISFPRLADPSWEFGGLGFLLLLGIPAGIFFSYFITRRRAQKTIAPATLTAGFCSLITIFLMMPPAKPLWDAVPLLQYVGYPWRFAGIAGFFAVLGLPALTPLFKKNSNSRWWPTAVLIVAILLPQAWHHSRPTVIVQSKHSLGRETCMKCGTTTVAADEYTPVWVKRDPRNDLGARTDPESLIEPNQCLSRSVVEIDTNTRIVAIVDAAESCSLTVRTLYFPGWRAYIDDRIVKISPKDPYGFISFNIAPGIHEVKLAFEWTGIQRTALFLGGLGILLMIILPVALKQRSLLSA